MEYLALLENPIIQSEILNKKSRFIIVSYFWGRDNKNKNSVKNLTYGQQVDRLISQCRNLKINYSIAEYPVFAKKGLYQIALGLKGHFIAKMMDKYPSYNVIFIDSDLQILHYPHLFEMEADCFFLNWNMYSTRCFNPYQLELPGGVLGFGNTHGARVLLKILIDYMINHLSLAEDKSFSGIVTRHFMNTYLRCVWIPLNYMYMFDKHEYDPSIGKYTKIVSLDKELKGEIYTPDDIVMIHEDFETGALDDVFLQKVGKKSRYPPKLDTQLGEKLRCIEVEYRNYINFGLNKNQYMNFIKDFKENERDDLYINKILKPIKINQRISKLMNSKKMSNYLKSSTLPFIIVTCIKNHDITNLKSICESYKIPLIVLDENKKLLNKASVFYTILSKIDKSLVYLDPRFDIKHFPKLFTVKNMDFMTINLNNTTTHLNEKLCSDIRILKTHDDTIYYFANNDLVMEFLKIWNEYNCKMCIQNHFQHKSLEYAFNISLSINKMRCYWLPKDYILGPVLSFPKNQLKKKNEYPNKKFRTLTKKLRQCGLKPKLDYGEPLPTHYHGSINGAIYHNKYGHLFLEL
jgi:hypothetical protein